MIINEQISQALANNYEVWLDYLQEISSNEDDIEYTRTVLEYACDTSLNYGSVRENYYEDNAIELDATLNYTYTYSTGTFSWGNSYTGPIKNPIYGASGCSSMYEIVYKNNNKTRIATKGSGYYYDN